MQHSIARPGGYTLYAESHGEGAALVFLNGLSQSTANWMSHTRAFRDRFRVVVYDARGQGRSTLGQGPISLAGHVGDLRALLITSLEDPLVSTESATRLASLLRAHHEAWTGAGHTIPIELPERWRNAVAAFLEG